MLKKTISYEDYNGDKHVEDFYFNLTRSEIVEMEFSMFPGTTLTDTLKMIIDTKDAALTVKMVKDIILNSYGEKSDDGKRFIKNEKIREEFEQSSAYDALYMELATDPEKSIEFISGLIPKALREQLGDNPEETIRKTIDEMKQS